MSRNSILLTVVLSVFLWPDIFGQSAVRGQVLDSLYKPIKGAHLILSPINDENAALGTITDSTGRFEINMEPGYYHLKVSYMGFKGVAKTILIEYAMVDLGQIVLNENSFLLEPIAVEGSVLPVIVKGDTTEINANAYKSNPDADAERLLEKMPTISITNGKIQAEGEEVKKVLVDGRPFFGDDPNAAVKNLPAEVIDKIQIFDDLSDQAKLTGFDDGNSEKTINIITRKEFRNGTFGKIDLGHGTDDRYQISGLMNRFKDDQRLTVIGQSNNINQQNFSTVDLAGVTSNAAGRGPAPGGFDRPPGAGPMFPGRGPGMSGDVNDFLMEEQPGLVSTDGFGVNYTDEIGKKLSLNASYFYNSTDNAANTTRERQYFADSLDQQYLEEERSNSTNKNHRVNLRVKYNLSRSDAIIFTPSFTLQEYKGTSDQLTKTVLNGEVLSSSGNRFRSDLVTFTLQNRLLWQHRFKKMGRTLSLHISQSFSPSKADSELQSIIGSDGQASTLDQLSDLEQGNKSYEARLMYTEPISQKLLLQINYSPGLQMGESDKLTFAYDSLTEEYDDLRSELSNSFDSRYAFQQGGAGFLYRLGRGGMLMFNTNYQYSRLETTQEFPAKYEASRNYSALLPMVRWRYKTSDHSNLNVMLRTNTRVPEITQLQEVLDNSNPQQLSIGNPDLNQQYQYNMFARYNRTKPVSSSSLFIMLAGAVTNDYIGTSTTIASSDTLVVEGIQLNPGTQLSKPVNLDGYFNLRMFSTLGLPVDFLKSNLNLNLSTQYSRLPGLINGALNYTHNTSIALGAVVSSNVSKKIDFTLSTNSVFNLIRSSLSSSQNTQYFNQQTKIKFDWNIWDGLVYRTNLNHQYYVGLNDAYDTNYLMWSMGIAYKFMQNDRAEVGVEGYDLLDQNQNISRTITETYYEDIRTYSIQRYFMITFRYYFGLYNIN